MVYKYKSARKFLSLFLVFAMTVSLVPHKADSAKTQDHPGLRLQTILVDNWGPVWTTESWGGQNLTPNMNWTTLTIRDYYENGYLIFEVRHTGSGNKNFMIGLKSLRHGTEATIYWTNTTAGKALTATPAWDSFSLSIKALCDANPSGAFSLDDLWYISVTGVSAGTPLEFRNVTISSPDDERQYPFIKVNQAGYGKNGSKTARISYFSKFGNLNGKTFQVVNAANGEVIHSGTLSNAVSDAVSGEMVHIINFNEVTAPGEYFIRIPEAGLNAAARSPRDIAEGLDTNTIESVIFKIEQNAYEDLLTDLIRYFYFQRQGLDLEAKYAGKFARENLHPNDSAIRKWSDRNNPSAVTHDVSQGWYDAGDYGKYLSPAVSTVSDLLFAYELFPEVFNRLELNIPETDPGNPRYVDAPGVLSEIKWELDMILKFEHSSKDGSFYVAANYDGNTIYMEDTRTRETTHTSPTANRDLRSHQATAGAAAVLAHAYLVYKDIPAYAVFAEKCLETAVRAWGWVTNAANSKNMSIDAANREYTFNNQELDREMFWAAGALYRAVKVSGGNPAVYDTYIQSNYTNSNVIRCFDASDSLSYNHGGRSFLGYVHYLYENNSAVSAIKNRFVSAVNHDTNPTQRGFGTWRNTMFSRYPDNWGTNYPDWGYWWGSNQVTAQSSMTFLLGSMLLEGLENLPANVFGNIENTAHHMLGINPMSFSYVSGHGENSVMNIYSGIFSKDKKLTPYQTPPGYFTEGTNIYDNRHLSKFNGKCYLDSDGEYTTNENTIYGNAAMVFLVAAVMAKTYEPPVKIKENLYISSVNLEEGTIELRNPNSDFSVLTRGLFLTDNVEDEDDLFKWQIPAFIVRAGETVKIEIIADDTEDFLHRLQISIDLKTGDTLYLVTANGEELHDKEIE